MKYSIYDKISKDELQKAIDNANAENVKSFRQELEERYTYETFDLLGITKEEAILINLHSKKTINRVYFDNIRYFTNVARFYARKFTFGARIIEAEDILQQIYVDIRFYDFTSRKTFNRCLRATARTYIYGGIENAQCYKDGKINCSIYKSVSAHNSKMEAGTELIDFLRSPEETNPETIFINREEKEARAEYEKITLSEIASKLTLKQRQKFYKMFGGEND